MGRLIWGAVLFGVGTVIYFWLTAQVPGGEMRYEQFIRLTTERHSFNM